MQSHKKVKSYTDYCKIDMTNGFKCKNKNDEMLWKSNNKTVFPCCETKDDIGTRKEAAERLARLSNMMQRYEDLFAQLENDKSVKQKMLANASPTEVAAFERQIISITKHLRKAEKMLKQCDKQYMFSSPFFTGEEYFDTIHGKMCVPMENLADHIEGDIVPLLLDAEDTFSKLMTGTTPHRNKSQSEGFFLSLKKAIHRVKGVASQLGKLLWKHKTSIFKFSLVMTSSFLGSFIPILAALLKTQDIANFLQGLCTLLKNPQMVVVVSMTLANIIKSILASPGRLFKKLFQKVFGIIWKMLRPIVAFMGGPLIVMKVLEVTKGVHNTIQDEFMTVLRDIAPSGSSKYVGALLYGVTVLGLYNFAAVLSQFYGAGCNVAIGLGSLLGGGAKAVSNNFDSTSQVVYAISKFAGDGLENVTNVLNSKVSGLMDRFAERDLTAKVVSEKALNESLSSVGRTIENLYASVSTSNAEALKFMTDGLRELTEFVRAHSGAFSILIGMGFFLYKIKAISTAGIEIDDAMVKKYYKSVRNQELNMLPVHDSALLAYCVSTHIENYCDEHGECDEEVLEECVKNINDHKNRITLVGKRSARSRSKRSARSRSKRSAEPRSRSKRSARTKVSRSNNNGGPF
jgi:hypothetical protein